MATQPRRKVSPGLPSLGGGGPGQAAPVQKLPAEFGGPQRRMGPPADSQPGGPAPRSDFADQVRVNKVYRWK